MREGFTPPSPRGIPTTSTGKPPAAAATYALGNDQPLVSSNTGLFLKEVPLTTMRYAEDESPFSDTGCCSERDADKFESWV
jgi:hypothetical protein